MNHAYDLGMRRSHSPHFLGPTDICGACGAYCFVLIEAGICCYKCHVGFFMHRRFWRFAPCPWCSVKASLDCGVCRGSNVMATPLESVDEFMVAAELEEYERKHLDCITPRGKLQ